MHGIGPVTSVALALVFCVLLAALNPWLGLGALLLFLFLATTRPGMGIYGPAITRGKGGVALTGLFEVEMATWRMV